MQTKDRIELAEGVRLGQNAVLTGTVTIGCQTSIWHNVILRGDVEPITIGERCNIQDNTMVHGQLNRWSTVLGNDVSVGHCCILHGCQLANHSFIGMGSILMNGSRIGSYVLVAAGSLIPQGNCFETPYTLVMGRPGRIVRELKQEEVDMIQQTPLRYVEYAKQWLPEQG
jgi:carbonic anhydrase/acetyltransferase-like protein (isoleucine patch superfamily)